MRLAQPNTLKLFVSRILMTASICLALKNPKKISVVVRPDLLKSLQEMAEQEGRSLSNLCAHLLEKAHKEPFSNR